MPTQTPDQSRPSHADPSGTGPSRRLFLGGGLATALTASMVGTAHADPTPIRAAVHELRDQWTKATGLAELLRRSGVVVSTLDLGADPSTLGVDLVAFGSFTNNAASYATYAKQQGAALQRFVSGGGVVLDLAQSDQFGAETPYLPAGMRATLTDLDFDSVYPLAADHPLVADLRVVDQRVFTGRNPAIRVSWETLQSWTQMRVLLACVSGAVAPPCLLEGAHGSGRFLVSSLTVDKCFDAVGAAVHGAAAVADSEAFFVAVARYVASVREGRAPAVVSTPDPAGRATGPLIGDVGTRTARVWYRPATDQQTVTRWRCEVTGPAGTAVAVAELSVTNDHTVVFAVDGLRADSGHTIAIRPDGSSGEPVATASFRTAPLPQRRVRTVMGLGSCAPSTPDHIWQTVVDEGCDSFVLLGDTPYVDSGDLGVARRKHREFLQQPELASMISSMPVWGTWDDHDFGGNDVHGDFTGKQNTRTAFVDYRANAGFGHDAEGRPLTERTAGQGIYTSLRRGPIEVFLLDPRWFSRTEPSWADPSKPTCLGRVQWEWLKRALLRSTAPFKVLASGMIWDDKQNSESDDWGTYAHEREAIFDFVADHEIAGVVLVGGDIHVSRALNYGPRVGYDLWQFIISPMHGSTIPSLNVPNPALVHSAVEPHVFCRLEADTTVSPATLTATWINRDGRRIFEVRRTATELRHSR